VKVCFGDVNTPIMRPIGLTGADASGAGIEVVAMFRSPPPQSSQVKTLLSSYT
jgi:hypothetical protein